METMRYYPVHLDIKNRVCLVVGGGRVATRKVNTLSACGAKVTVISPEVTPALTDMAGQGLIKLEQRPYHSSDQDGAFLVIAATNDAALNRLIHNDAQAAGRLCNIIDQPRQCDFIVPSVIRQGDLMVTISTGGKSPAFAKHLRRQLKAQFGPEYASLLQLMGAVRQRLLEQAHAPETHKKIFEQLIAADLLMFIRAGDRQQIDAILTQVAGPDYVLDQLLPEFKLK